MQKAYIIIASNGAEVIDSRPEAEIFISNMEYLEERYKRNRKRRSTKKRYL